MQTNLNDRRERIIRVRAYYESVSVETQSPRLRKVQRCIARESLLGNNCYSRIKLQLTVGIIRDTVVSKIGLDDEIQTF